MRDKEQTKAKIVSAVGELIAENGFSKVGINAIARHANVDKVLIYRYFDGLDGLYKAYASSSDFWPSIDELLGDEAQRVELMQQSATHMLGEFFARYADALRARPLTLEIMAWETVERNALTIALEEVRERLGLELADHLAELELAPADWLAITNIFVSAIHYLAIRARKISHFTGMDLHQDESWQRLIASIQQLIRNTGDR